MSSHVITLPRAIALLRGLYVITFCSGHRHHREFAARSFGLIEFTLFGPLAMDGARMSKEHSATRCSSHLFVDVLV